MSGFSQTMEGDWKKLQEAMKKAGNINYQKLHKQIGEALAANTQLRFVDQVDPKGNKWKKGHKTSGQTLTKTTRLSSSVTYNATKRQVEVGTNVKYAAIHQFGGTIKAKKKKALRFNVNGKWAMKKKVTMPKRPFIGFSKDDEADIKRLFQDALKGTLK